MNDPVCISRVSDVYEAWIIAARLKDSGIHARVHGEALGPYTMTVGAMALTEIWVSCDDAQDAREILEVVKSFYGADQTQDGYICRYRLLEMIPVSNPPR